MDNKFRVLQLWNHFNQTGSVSSSQEFQDALLPWTGKHTHINSTNDPAESILLPLFDCLGSLLSPCCHIQENFEIVCKHCNKQLSKGHAPPFTILELHLFDLPFPTITELIRSYVKSEDLSDYALPSDKSGAPEHSCPFSHLPMLDSFSETITARMKRSLTFGSSLIIGLKRLQQRQSELILENEAIDLEPSLYLQKQCFYLSAIICHSHMHFFCFAKRNSNWFLFNDGHPPLLLEWIQVQGLAARDCVWLLYEVEFVESSQIELIFPLENKHLWCYQNASLQFLYTSTFLKEQVQEACLAQAIRRISLESTFQDHLSTNSERNRIQGPVPLTIYREEGKGEKAMLKTSWSNHCHAFTQQRHRCKNRPVHNGYCHIHYSV